MPDPRQNLLLKDFKYFNGFETKDPKMKILDLRFFVTIVTIPQVTALCRKKPARRKNH